MNRELQCSAKIPAKVHSKFASHVCVAPKTSRSFHDLDQVLSRSDAMQLQLKTAMELLRGLDRQAILRLVAQRIRALAGGAAVAIDEYSPLAHRVTLRVLECSFEQRQRVIAILGRDPVGFSIELPAEARRQRRGSLASAPEGIFELLSGQLPQQACRQLEAALGTGPVYKVVWDGGEDAFGAMAVFTRAGQPLRNQRLIEVLVAQAASALERLRAEEALRESDGRYGALVESLRSTNRRLVDADQRKNDFLAVLSHELRNPLAPIKNSLYILERAIPGGEQACRARAVISRQVDQLSRLVDDLLDMARIARNKVSIERQPLELNELVGRILEDYYPTFERAGLTLQFEPASVPLLIEADGHRIAQVFGNLLENAAKFTPRAGHVRVTLSHDTMTGQAVTQVADSGVGLTAEVVERVFEPFVQAEASLSRSKGGLGLGLALVKGVVELHGGTVSATSDGPGRGSVFTIRLPLQGSAPPCERLERD